jgi:ADP-ribose diphosphatase
MRQKKLPEILASSVAAKSRLFTIEALHLKFSNGVERNYERMKGSGRGAVMIIPVRDDGQVLMISEYSAGTHSYELGFPKGLIDPGESAEQAANRELMEEIGFGAKKLVPLKQVTLAPGYFKAQMTILLAFDLYEQKLEGDEPEPLEVVPWPLSESDKLLEHPDFTEARSIAALLLAQKWLEKNGQ